MGRTDCDDCDDDDDVEDGPMPYILCCGCGFPIGDFCGCTCVACNSGAKFSNLHDSENAVTMSVWSSGLNVLPNDALFGFGMWCLCVDS